jgi:hypothetical protein
MVIKKDPAQARALVWVTRGLFIVNAAIWCVFAILLMTKTTHLGLNAQVFSWIVAVLMVGNAGVMLFLSWGIGKRHRWLFYFALVFLAVNIVLSITDEVGAADLITMAIDIALFALVILTRRR